MNFRNPDQLLMPWSPRLTISAARAAEILDVSKDVVCNMCQEGAFKAYKVRPDKPNSPWRINYDSLVAYIEDMHKKNGLDQRF
jgi:hypothetical protein